MDSKHHPNGGASSHCNNAEIESLIAQYKRTRDVESLSQIVALTQERALTLIRTYRTTRYKPIDELMSDVNCKVIKAVDKFNPQKGSAFTFLSHVISNVLFTSVSNARKDLARYHELTRGVLSELADKSYDRSAVEDINFTIKSRATTILTDETELEVQRWYIDSFTDKGFNSRRHECANAALAVFGIAHGRSRELYDLTMLEVRRVLYSGVQWRAQTHPGRLIGTRLAWMSRYTSLMNCEEFTKFVVLMRDLAPYLLLLVNARDSNRRRDRSPTVSRKNIELILYGDPDAVLLFNSSISHDKQTIRIDSKSL